MKRLTTGILLAFLAAFLLGCGGNSAPILNNGDTNNNRINDEVVVPTSITGSHSTTNKPGQVNVVAGGTEAQLTSTVENLGYTVLKYDNGQATIQVPVGSELKAADVLEKQYNIITAEPVRVINTPTAHYDLPTLRTTSFYPQFPDYGEVVFGFDYDGTNTTIGNFIGQSPGYNVQKFNGAWEVTLVNAAVASQPVSVAIIDSGWWDFTIQDQPGLNDVADDIGTPPIPGTVLDTVNSGFVDGTGAFTAGLAAAAWEMDTNGDPYRNYGNSMLGMLAGGTDGFVATVRGFDLNGDTIITEDEVWNEGIMGANGNANYILIKTGTGDGTTWSFTDNEIAESIDHAVASGANIILLGMFAPGTVSANVSTAIANARAADVLVIAPAGDVVLSFDGTAFTQATVDITVDSVTPASDPNVVSVAATGTNRIGDLGQVDFGGGPINNVGTGWFPNWNAPFGGPFTELGLFSNTGATIAGFGIGMGFGPRPFLIGGAGEVLPGVNYNGTFDRFGTNSAAAYVAGAASMVFQTLSEVNGIPPTDDEVLAELLGSVQYRGIYPGIDDPNIVGLDDGGLLDAGLAVTSAVNGGSLVTPLPAMELTGITVSQPFAAVTRGTDFSFTATLINGTAPFELTVDWGNGAPADVIAGWNSGDPVDLIGGYDELGVFAVNITVEDSNGLTESFPFGVTVINPLAATITIETDTGAAASPAALQAGTEYRFLANAANVYSGDGNVTTYSWDFNGDLTEDATGPAPTFEFPAAGNNTITLTITETLRPDTIRTQAVTVVP